MTGRRPGAAAGPTHTPAPARARLAAVALVLVLGLGLLSLTTLDLPSVGTVRAWLAGGGFTRWAAACLVLTVALLTPVSRTALSLLLGAAAGFPAGLAVALTAGLLAGLIGFLLSRRLGRAVLAGWLEARFGRVERLFRDRGFVAVLTARLLPVAPFAVVTYAAGLTAVRLGPYLLGTAVGLIPWSVLYVGVGASAVRLGGWAGHLDNTWVVAGTAAAAIVVAAVTWRRNGARSGMGDR